SYPLLLVVVIYRMTLQGSKRDISYMLKAMRIGLAIAFAPLGLLPLIKGSLLVTSGTTAALCCVLSWHRNQRFLAYSALIIPSTSALLFWVLAGQPAAALLAY